MKKKYESPRAVADLFYPEESISSCYNIACEYGIMGGEKGIKVGDVIYVGEAKKSTNKRS